MSITPTAPDVREDPSSLAITASDGASSLVAPQPPPVSAALPHSDAYSLVRPFRYRATERATGRLREGEQSGVSAYAVRASLRRIGLEVDLVEALDTPRHLPAWLSVMLHPFIEAWHERERRRRRILRSDLFDALATLINAGCPLEQAVGILASSSSRSRSECRMLRDLRERLRAGVPLSQACASMPGWFDTLDTAMLDTGSQAGDLSAVLISLSAFHQRSSAIGQKLFMALIYPAVLLIAALGAIIFLSSVPLPKLLALIQQAHRAPPRLTVDLVWFGQAMVHDWPIMVVIAIVLMFMIPRLLRQIPLEGWLGDLVHRNLIARARLRSQIASVACTLARLLHCGMPLLEAVEVTITTVRRRDVILLLTQAAQAIRRGEELSTVVSASTLMEPEFAQLLHLGERSGELTVLLERIAERYSRTAERTIDRLAAMLGPLAILILASLIAVVALAAILPIVQLGDLV
jgi:general secretion pathway protein F